VQWLRIYTSEIWNIVCVNYNAQSIDSVLALGRLPACFQMTCVMYLFLKHRIHQLHWVQNHITTIYTAGVSKKTVPAYLLLLVCQI